MICNQEIRVSEGFELALSLDVSFDNYFYQNVIEKNVKTIH